MTKRAHRRHQQTAFSMIELMVVVAIASILMALAVPSFRQTIDRQKLTTAASDLYGAVSLARSEAIRRGAQVKLNADGSSWDSGWYVLVNETSAAGSVVPTKIYTHAKLDKAIVFTQLPTFNNSLFYEGTGRAKKSSDGSAITSDRWEISIGTQRRQILIEGTGRPRLCDPGTASGLGACANSG